MDLTDLTDLTYVMPNYAMTSVLPDKPVWCGDGVEVGLLPVVHKGVRLPDLAQHLNGQGEGVLFKY